MILISGNDPIIDGLCSALDSLGPTPTPSSARSATE